MTERQPTPGVHENVAAALDESGLTSGFGANVAPQDKQSPGNRAITGETAREGGRHPLPPTINVDLVELAATAIMEHPNSADDRYAMHWPDARDYARVVLDVITPPPESQARVKALEWEKSLNCNDEPQWSSKGAAISYRFTLKFRPGLGEQFFLFETQTWFEKREDVVAAAQADYERRILSAIASEGQTRCRDCDGYNCDDGCAYPDPAPQTNVRPLEWTPLDYVSHDGHTGRRIVARAKHPYGSYSLEKDADDKWWILLGGLGKEIAGPLSYEADAKSAAQQDLVQRIHEALFAPPPPQTNVRASILEEAAKIADEEAAMWGHTDGSSARVVAKRIRALASEGQAE
ncbi:hypothetical protein CYG48_12695 [Neorhizobium sp. SOG26]|uniref:hypothetical protein n=1 Tax=Neorhizobium sp. SOG26 TaxID=2060726 RepID=UPI000E591148|nr:hypothetical protein [Neorhizobium sp. SOG26]AXV16469.1 hypothetical protein CYG48_12695 [Neorhizobium sp. SOG26]